MAFNKTLVSIRKIGRNLVLPVDRIRAVCQNALGEKKIKTVLDFGAGTLFWANWFVREFGARVCAVDTYYDNIGMPESDGVVCYSDLSTCLLENADISLVWACDVLHHLSPSDSDVFLKEICDKTDIVIIKDIDAARRVGNFMNRMHDMVINREKVYDIYPDKISAYFQSCGFETSCHFIPKIWYPHFVLVAMR